MNWQQIEMFNKAAKYLNFTKVAKEFYTTQPTVSRQIRLLEEELGVDLFIRSNKEIRITPQGAIMLKKFTIMMDSFTEGLRECKLLKDGINGRIRIGCLESVELSQYILPITKQFSKEHSNIQICIEKRSFAELREKLQNGQLDIIFTLEFEMVNMNGFFSAIYDKVECGILMSKNHPLAKKEQLELANFQEETFILPEPLDSPGRIEELNRILKPCGIVCKNHIYVPNLSSLILNVGIGNGVAILDSSIEAVQDTNHFYFYKLPKDIAALNLIYAWGKENLNPAVAIFLNTLLLNQR